MGSCGIICCLPKCICKLIFSVIVFLGILALIIWFILRPNLLQIRVDDASLTQFNVTDNNVLHYNLALALNLRNPNKKIGFHYDQIEARVFYDGQRFDSVMLTPFYQGHKNTTILHPVFQGQRLLPSVQGEYNKDKTDGKFKLKVKLFLKLGFKVGLVNFPIRLKPRAKCAFEVPLGSNPATGFTPKSCTFF
ncbi:hypothetical protein MKW98_010149 [Papaver atlanticum]|uniref:Late embryogenesis abundant protein LEA-2 subgroup domain-containing protein n=1 Tax=Papaver atlanticum TaxID=357466 RepID=A0AAD4RYU1_9MAGN|nr:hypothetical protein MKW98_010149 [Papaver atlanticum]